jgi:hypothetical protein
LCTFKILCKARSKSLVVCPPSHHFSFHLALDVFSFMMHIKLAFPHSLALELSHCICGQSLNPTCGDSWFPFSLHSWWGKDVIPWFRVGCLCIHHKRCWLHVACE